MATLFKVGLLGVGAGLGALWWFQSHLLYMPVFGGRKQAERGNAFNMAGFRSPSEYGLPYESHTILTSDGVKIHGWLLLQKDSHLCPTILFFHGNAGNIGFRLPNAQSLYQLTGSNIFLLDYRGYGDSEGIPSEKGLKIDAQSTLDYLTKLESIHPDRIFVFGRSLGGAVGIDLTFRNQERIKGLIVENTFLTISDMVHCLAAQFVPNVHRNIPTSLLTGFLSVFMTSHWKSRELVGEITTPIMFISGLADELVPPSHMVELHKAAVKSRYTEFYGVPNGTHNDTFARGGYDYYTKFSDFISRMLP